MANMTFGVNLIPKNSDNTQQTLGNSENKWDIYADNLTATTINNKTPVSGVKGVYESEYRTGNVNISPANIGAKALQSNVTSPSANGTAIAFIDSISQNQQGVIASTKKTVANATTSTAGLMSAADKTKLNGIASGAQVNSVTGVKGNAEASYRTGNVNITPTNIGLGNVQNKSPSTILSELTKTNVFQALGYNPANDNVVIADSTARTISEGTSSAYSVTNLTANHVVVAWQFSGDYSDSNPPADITVTTSNGSYTITATNLAASGITMKPIFIKP